MGNLFEKRPNLHVVENEKNEKGMETKRAHQAHENIGLSKGHVNVNEFLEFIDNNKLKLTSKRTEDNIQDIRSAVEEVVESVAKHIGRKCPFYEVSHKYAVGSMAEGTKIVEPNEFDFILVLKKTMKDDLDVKFHWCEIYDSGNVCFHAHIKNGASVHSSYNRSDVFTTSKWDVLVPGHSEVLGKNALFDWNAMIDRPTGVLTWDTSSLDFSTFKNGPAWTLQFRWYGNNCPDIHIIKVDITFAIEMTNIEENNEVKNALCEEYYLNILEEGKFFLISSSRPFCCGEDSMTSSVTFTTTEVKMVRELTKAHRICYRILKCIQILKSYMLKTLVLRHSIHCTRSNDQYECLKDIIKDILNSPCDKSFEFAFNTIEIPSLFMPTVKVKDHISGRFGYMRFRRRLNRIVEYLKKLQQLDIINHEKEFEKFSKNQDWGQLFPSLMH